MTQCDYTKLRADSTELARSMDCPPFPVVQQYGFYSFAVGDGRPAAVKVVGQGVVYASDFRAWAGKPLPEANDDFGQLEPTAEQFVAMLRV